MRTSARWCLVLASLVGACGVSAAWSLPVADFSRTAIGFSYHTRAVPSAVQPVFVSNVGDAALNISAITLSGSHPEDFSVAGTCAPPVRLAPGERCRIDVVMIPVGPLRTPTSATITVTSDAAPATQDIRLTGFIDPGNATPQVPSMLFSPSPHWLDFGPQAVGTSSAPVTMAITNLSVLPWTLNRLGTAGGNASDFTITSSCPADFSWAHGQTCTATITFHPQAAGPRATELSAAVTWTTFDADYRYSLTGVGTVGPVAPVQVVEYYNASLDHYFITWIAAEQANLDAGNTPTAGCVRATRSTSIRAPRPRRRRCAATTYPRAWAIRTSSAVA